MFSIQTEGSFKPKKASNSPRASVHKPTKAAANQLPRRGSRVSMNRIVKHLYRSRDRGQPKNRHRSGSCSNSPEGDSRHTTISTKRRRRNSIKVHRSLNYHDSSADRGVEFLRTSSRKQIIKQVAAECETS